VASGLLGRLAGLRSLPSSAVRVLGAAVGFVVLAAALFAGVGAWQDRDTTAGRRDRRRDPAPAPAPAPAARRLGSPVTGPTTRDGPSPRTGTRRRHDGQPVDAPDGESPAPARDPPGPPTVRDVTIQLLNGIGADGAAAISRVRTTLTEAGFRISASNAGRPYDDTTIFYTVGFEARGVSSPRRSASPRCS
jgi:hypothetical protein